MSILEINYDAGRSQKTYEHYVLSLYSAELPKYPNIIGEINLFLLSTDIIQRIRYINLKFDMLIELHKYIFSSDRNLPQNINKLSEENVLDTFNAVDYVTKPAIHYKYKLLTEELIFLIKQIFDNLVQISYIITNSEIFKETKIISIDNIGTLLSSKHKESIVHDIIFGSDIYGKDNTKYLEIINDLFNSQKHCVLNADSHQLISPEVPSILSYYAKHNNLNGKIYYHNHNAYHIMMGFQDNILRILKNQKRYIELV